MDIAIIGTGYVGLTTGACFADTGHNVICVDIDPEKVKLLNEGICPIYEAGLNELIQNNTREGRLRFTSSISDAANAQVFFIAVGTPSQKDGSANLDYVQQAARDIANAAKKYFVVVTKSTVPVGTTEKVSQWVADELKKKGSKLEFDVASNPEFLKQGNAVQDFLKPDRVIIGCEGDRVREIMTEIYRPFTLNHERTLFMSTKAAEMTKYVANSMLATKISFMNEIANICEALGVEVENVRKGIGYDSRIGFSFIYPGCGYGGSCFPKDVRALIHLAKENGSEPKVLEAVEETNQIQKTTLFKKVVKRFGKDLKNKHFAVWGLAFKPGTDDMREAPSISLINSLIQAGATVKAYDPVATETAKHYFPKEYFDKNLLQITSNPYSAIEGSSAVLLVTEWKLFRNPDFETIKELMKEKVIFDGRNQYNPVKIKNLGFEYQGIGQ